MKKLNKNPIVAVTVALALLFGLPGLTGPVATHAATATLVDLGTAGDFAVLSKTAISSAGTTIIGNTGVSPAAHTFITGFSLIGDETLDTFLTSAQVTGEIYAANLQSPTPANMTTTISNMETAFSAAMGQPAGVGPFLNIGGGTVSTQTLVPGVYTWGSNVNITGDLTLACGGDASAVFVFQISGNLVLDANQQILRSGNCQNSKIFWAVSGTTDLMADSIFEGTLLAGPAVSEITVITGATVNGRLLGEKTIALQAGTSVTIPTPDTTAPVITLVGSTPVNLTVGDSYSDAGATALDDIDGNITGSIVTVNPVNTAIAGTYTVTYNVTDSSTNSAVEVTRTVVVSAVPVPTPTPTPAPSSGGGGGTTYCTEERTTFCRPVTNQTIGASTDGQVLGAFSPEENEAQTNSIRDSLISLIKQLINLLQAQIIVMQDTPGFPNTGFAPR